MTDTTPPTDRAAILREMISRLETRTRQAPAPGARLHSFRDVARVLIDELRRLADEAPGHEFLPDSPRAPGLCATCGDSRAWHRRVADETPQTETQATPCSARPCNAAADELCDNHARIKYHAEGEHAFCGPECDAEA